MKRLTRNTLTLLSSLLCAVTIFFWIRSATWCDSLTFLAASGNGYALRSGPGRVAIQATENLRGFTKSYNPTPQGWSASSKRWGATTTYAVRSQDVRLHDGYVRERAAWTEPPHHFIGFAWARMRVYPPLAELHALNQYVHLSIPPVYHRVSVWIVPSWFLLLLFALLPTLRIIHRFRRKHRIMHGLCPNCGYDLRASPGRCPECGQARPGPCASCPG